MTETQTPLPDLTVSAQAHFVPGLDVGRGWRVEFAFDGFPTGDADDAASALVAHWRMTREVAESVVLDLYREATSEDGCDYAEVLLTADPDAAFEADPS